MTARGTLVTVTSDVRREAGTVEQLVRLDVERRGCWIGHEQHGANEPDGEGAADDVDQVQGAGHPCQLARRSARNGVHQDLLQLLLMTLVRPLASTAG